MLKYAIDIFGLEKDVVDKVSPTEQSKFVRSLIYLLIITVLTSISTIWGGRLLTGSWLLGFLIGVIFTYIVFSIMRFALITIKLPVAGDYYEYVKNRQHQINNLKPRNKPVEEELITSVSEEKQKSENENNSDNTTTPTNKRPLFKRLKKLLSEKIRGISFNIGVIVRTFTFCVIMQVPIFFTVVLLNKNTSDEIIASERERVYEFYKSVLYKSKNTELKGLEKRRIELQNNLIELRAADKTNSITYNNKVKELNEIETNISQIEVSWDKAIPLKLNRFRLSIQDDFYVAPLISELFIKIDYWIIEMVYLILFFSPVRIFRNLRKKSELYQYNLNVVNKYRKQITENHKALEAHRKQKLLDYGFDLQKTISMYRDAPFNTVKNAGIIREKEADITEFYAN